MPLVSVIMPTFNRAWIIERAVRSVLNQTCADWELIVVDDGSIDDTLAVLERVRDARVRVVAATHVGQAAARNRGLAVATGSLLAYLDTDNIWHPAFLEVMTTELTERYVMAYCSQHLFLVEGDRQQFRVVGRKVRSFPFNPVLVSQGSYIDMNSVLHRHEVLDEIGPFDEQLGRLVDWDFFARMAVTYPFAIKHVDQVLCDYYYFPRNTAATITNGVISDAQVRGEFGLHDEPGDAHTIRQKVQQLVQQRRSVASET